jgi:hypothetical protein
VSSSTITVAEGLAIVENVVGVWWCFVLEMTSVGVEMASDAVDKSVNGTLDEALRISEMIGVGVEIILIEAEELVGCTADVELEIVESALDAVDKSVNGALEVTLETSEIMGVGVEMFSTTAEDDDATVLELVATPALAEAAIAEEDDETDAAPVLAQAKLIFVTSAPEAFGALKSHVMSTYGQQTLSVPTFAISPLTNTLVEDTTLPDLAPVLSTSWNEVPA